MKVLTTAQGSYVTGSDIADAVIRCNRAVTETREIDCVDIPFLNEHGDVRWVQLLVGPPYEIHAGSIDSAFPELVEPDAVARVDDRTRESDPFTSTRFTLDDVEWLEGVHQHAG